MEKNSDKVSYCIGFESAEHIARQFKGLNLELVVEGFKDALYKLSPLLNEEERKGVITKVLWHMQENQKAAVQKKNSKVSQAWKNSRD